MTDLDLLENCKKYKCPCLNKRYCGPVCQKSDWNSGHKDECRQTLKDPAKMMSKIMTHGERPPVANEFREDMDRAWKVIRDHTYITCCLYFY
jgi:hypothetical protein